MPEIAPFRALRYDPRAVPDLAAAVAPPYDVISPEARRAYAAHPYNIVRLTLPQAGEAGTAAADGYQAAGHLLAAWRAAGVLRRDPEPALYPYEQAFPLGGQRWRRRGVLALVRLAAYEERQILPHERTFARYKDDRLRLMRACPANLEAILGFYGGAGDGVAAWLDEAMRAAPVAACEDRDSVAHRLWRVTGEAIARLSAMLDPAPLVIADGHHRYETALTYRNERPSEVWARPEQFVLADLVHADDPGLVVLPTHRLVRAPVPPDFRQALGAAFAVEDRPPGPASLGEALATLQQRRAAGPAFLVGWPGGGVSVARLRDEALPEELREAGWPPALARLDVAILHAVVIERLLGIRAGDPDAILYERDADRAWDTVQRGEAGLGLFLSAPLPAEVMALAVAGARMPQKSTYFYPKVLSGLVIRPLDDGG